MKSLADKTTWWCKHQKWRYLRNRNISLL